MANQLWKSLLVNPVLLSATLTVSATIGAAGLVSASEVKTEPTQTIPSLDQVNAYSNEGTVSANDAGQVTSVSQLSDVRPTDWAFQALQSLVERYGCIAGYPDRTFRGNRATTRFEFAAGLNACLDRVNELIAASTADLVKKEDLATLQKLQEQFAAELATIRGRVDSLEARTTTLEKQQFSTTTKLQGEAIFSISGAQGDAVALPVPGTPTAATARVQDNTTFSNRVRLSLLTSFTGRDTLVTRLQARNIPNFTAATGTNMSRLSYEGGGASGNQEIIDKLFYRFPIGNGGQVTIDALGGEFYNNMPNFNPLLASDGQGSISRFGRFNPIYRGGQGGTGVTVNLPLGSALTASFGYLAANSNDPGNRFGLFNGSNAAIGQLAFRPTNGIDIGLTYTRSYVNFANSAGATGVAVNTFQPLSGGTGSLNANNPFAGAPGGSAVAANTYGVQAAFRITPGLTLAGWGGYTEAFRQTGGGRAEIFNWAVSLAFPDLGGKGNLAGVIFGVPPKVTRNTFSPATRDDNGGTSYHLEGLYRFRFSPNLSVTPGIIVIFNPEHNNNNNTVYVGTIRTTFSF